MPKTSCNQVCFAQFLHLLCMTHWTTGRAGGRGSRRGVGLSGDDIEGASDWLGPMDSFCYWPTAELGESLLLIRQTQKRIEEKLLTLRCWANQKNQPHMTSSEPSLMCLMSPFCWANSTNRP
jgi:hypothetical protein